MNMPAAVGRPSEAVALIETSPPPVPACWTSKADWQSWLISAHLSGELITRVEDRGGYGGRPRVVRHVFVTHIDHCIDCHAAARARAQAVGKCNPSPQQLDRDEENRAAADPEG